jgi:hypothetical protein
MTRDLNRLCDALFMKAFIFRDGGEVDFGRRAGGVCLFPRLLSKSESFFDRDSQ